MKTYDLVIIGGGPAGLAAALKAKEKGIKNLLIIEREERSGGILKQCIHDGFGVVRFKERLTGPEYAYRFLEKVLKENIPIMNATFVHSIEKVDYTFELSLVNESQGTFKITSKGVILATGCRERTSRQVFIHGDRPAGVFSAGTAQYYVNVLGALPCKKCVILGSGDIGLIMARRLSLEGAEVLGVYEVKPTPSGLTRNIVQCLEDFNIPLHLSHTVSKVHGQQRVEKVTVVQVDDQMQPIEGTEKDIECDALILSVGLIPENEIAESLGIELDASTKGPIVDQNLMTSVPGVFVCGNALHVNDLVDYVSESAEIAANSACEYILQNSNIKTERSRIPVVYNKNDFLYVVPQTISITEGKTEACFYLRSREERRKTKIKIQCDEATIVEKRYNQLKPPEMERIITSMEECEAESNIELIMEEIV